MKRTEAQQKEIRELKKDIVSLKSQKDIVGAINDLNSTIRDIFSQGLITFPTTDRRDSEAVQKLLEERNSPKNEKDQNDGTN